jgi:hypothetical protein
MVFRYPDFRMEAPAEGSVLLEVGRGEIVDSGGGGEAPGGRADEGAEGVERGDREGKRLLDGAAATDLARVEARALASWAAPWMIELLPS